MKQKWHHITITIKLKIHTKNDCQLDFNDEDFGEDTIVELEERIEDAKLRKSSIEMETITLDNIYKLMLNFGKLYDIISDEEKKSLITYLINAMNPIEKNVKFLEAYIKLTKASRYYFCLDSEDYTGFLKILVNAKLRNAIGHNDVEYNSVDQLITYIPNPKDRTKKKTEYLLEFENEAMRMFQAILGVSKYLYRLRKLELMHDGKIPIMVQERAN